MDDRSLSGWLSHLESVHPQSVDLGLSRISRVSRELGLERPAFRIVTVAGTNGKGTVVYACEAVLGAHGVRCGRYTSPHLLTFNERICIGGAPASDDSIVAAFEAIERARGETTLTYFEFATLAALFIFAREGVDVAIMEVGLGGRLDAVNVVDATVAVITSIALDHQNWLGNTREKIGREKAAVARSGRPVILAEEDYPDSVNACLLGIGAEPLAAGKDWHWCGRGADGAGSLSLTPPGSERYLEDLPVPEGLIASNIAAALAAASLFLPAGLQEQSVRQVLRTLSIPARRQRLRVEDRELVLDVAHNPAAMGRLAAWLSCLRSQGGGQVYVAIGLMADKDLPAIVQALVPAVSGAFALALPGIERAETPERVWQVLDSMGIAAAQSEFTVDAVWQQLLAGSRSGDCIVFCGSFHSVAGIMSHLDLTTRHS